MFRTALITIAASLLFTGAGQAEVPRVATDIAPVHGLVARVMMGVGTPDLVMQPGASPHGYSMRPSEAMALSRSDFVIWMGEGLTPWLEGSVETLARDATVIELLDSDGITVLPFREGARFADHDSETEEDGHDDHGHDDAHGHEGIDPHAWLAPENGKLWLELIAIELAQFDPVNAETYRANAAAGRAEIDQAVVTIDAALAPLRNGGFVVFHDAFQYFETSFELSALAAISLGDASSPSPARIVEVRDTVAELGVSCVFSEPQFNPGLVAAVLDGTGAKTAVIDPMGTEIPLGPQFYPALLLDLGQRMAGCP
ncbi:zinc ABC transporter substrate-binding protein [Parasedimentitalea psychrophila]|uniref:High-affinity zinc uptake system protein ZnuA n=1 Tax=Parasedimentitalea psychrophila TaxID=2997337 RepID=A0A9Y2P3L7_9RHOB|nr:zinc ABC transporter substrate-binding protein [Parasedimentitalea psychrophila]WIY27796.1 zinc ABC transporter substrate-binding protein [Parasedimentitalea psychrophila]